MLDSKAQIGDFRPSVEENSTVGAFPLSLLVGVKSRFTCPLVEAQSGGYKVRNVGAKKILLSCQVQQRLSE